MRAARLCAGEDRRLTARRVSRTLIAVLCLVTATPAVGQRIQFPSMVTAAQPAPPSGGPVTTTPAPANTAPGTTFTPPGTPPPPVYGPPTVTLDGSVQPVHPSWDPYADPAAQPPLYPEGGYIQSGGVAEEPFYVINKIRFDYYWLAADGAKSDRLGMNHLELAGSLAFPFLWNPSPLVVTPGFAVNYIEGPEVPPAAADLPPQLYDAYLEAAWRPVITSWLSGDFAARVGVYSDFEEFNKHTIRYPSRGMAVLTFSSAWQVTFGVWYLDRNRVKLLPAGGVIWTPNQDTRWEVLFPNPRIAQRLTTIGNTDIWWYVRGEYGAGAWTVKHDTGVDDSIDINDLRVAFGTELVTLRGMQGYIEVGYVWDREIVYTSGFPDFKPDDTLLLGAGLAY